MRGRRKGGAEKSKVSVCVVLFYLNGVVQRERTRRALLEIEPIIVPELTIHRNTVSQAIATDPSNEILVRDVVVVVAQIALHGRAVVVGPDWKTSSKGRSLRRRPCSKGKETADRAGRRR